MKEEIRERLEELRAEMKAASVDATIIPQTDPHQSEYIASHWQVRRYLSGFTGSAGTLVVTGDKALLWTDSRYFLQAADELAGTDIELMKDGLPGTPSIQEYLIETLPSGSTVGIDGMLFSASAAGAMAKAFGKHGLKLDAGFDAVDKIWPSRPALPKHPIIIHEEKYAGLSAKDKIADMLASAKKQQADSAFISPLDEIAWALNIRSRDVKYNPVATAYLYISADKNVLFTDPDKVNAEVAEYLKGQGVETMPYDSVKAFIEGLGDEKALIEEAKTSATVASWLGDKAVKGESLAALPKAIKNETQLKGIRNAMVRDGVALVKSLMQIEKTMAEGKPLTELDVDRILRENRSQQVLYFDESFGTIAGYGPHGAIVHYEPDEESNSTIEPHGLLLIDSGAQYLDGTTDITRTIAMGEPTQMEKHDFTLVAKGHIALGSAVFPAGTVGMQLDGLARQFLWKEGLSYLHGTGHGVGHFLNVHEGPQSIRMNYIPTPLVPGMVTSNEPGLYREGIHGIRCENLVLTVPAMETEFGKFYKFENLTLFPFDLRLFETEIMTDEEIAWVNDYHRTVREQLTPHLMPEEAAWLAEKTATLTR
ncbi:MAG: aminopeptidase P family protein [Clostridium sp.]|nr:aminopeptidase P family protein [Clostridium sp.]